MPDLGPLPRPDARRPDAAHADSSHLVDQRSDAPGPDARRADALTRRQVLAWRNAVFAVFVLSGLSVATWVARIPGVRDGLALDTAMVGLLILGMSVGAVLGLAASAPLLARLGARRAMVLAIGIAAGGLVLIGVGTSLVPFVPLAGLGLAALGFGNGSVDVMMNVEGAAAERALGKTLLPLMHACFSIGTVTGAGIGAAAAAVRLPVVWHLTGMAVILLAGVLVAVRYIPLRPELGDQPTPTATSDQPTTTSNQPAPAASRDESIPLHPSTARSAWLARLRENLSVWADGRLILIGVVMLGMAFAEGSANDWLALAVVDGHHQTNATGAVAFGVFVAAMTVGRVTGGPLVDRLGRSTTIRITAAFGILGLLTFILAGPFWLVIVGTALWGLGCSLGFPLGMSAAAEDPDRAAARVSAVAMIGYCAFLVGPPLIGFLGQAFGLLNALWLLLVLVFIAGLCAPALRTPAPARVG